MHNLPSLIGNALSASCMRARSGASNL
jgi:hypothetical protein